MMITLIEATVISYLAEALDSTDVYAERPKNVPSRYYVVEKTSAGEENHISSATVAVQSVSGNSMLEAAEMSKEVETAMKGIVSVENVSKCRLNSAYNFTDPDTREYRYQAVFDLYYMEGD